MHNRGTVRLAVATNVRPSTSDQLSKMRPFLCYLSLWLWIQAAAGLTITSVSADGGEVEVGKGVAVEWQDAVGTVNASLVCAEPCQAATSISLLDSDIRSPFLWTPTEDFAGGRYYFQLQDESGGSLITSSPFSVKSIRETTSGPSFSPTPTDLTLDNVLTSSTPSESTPIYLPGVHLEPPGEYFDTAAKVAVAIGTTVVVLALLAVGGYCFYRKRKRAKRARRTGRKETTQPIATPFQSATRHPMALTSVDEERKMFQSASRQPIALTSVDEELRIESPKKNQSPTKKWPLVSPKSDPKDTKPVQSPASRRQTRPLERPVLMGTHELEQPQPELETPVLRRRPSELDGRMIYPSGTTEVDSIVEETPLTRRARTTRDEVGSEHWTFLRDSSATDLME